MLNKSRRKTEEHINRIMQNSSKLSDYKRNNIEEMRSQNTGKQHFIQYGLK
jgi:hypothetical protein